MNSVKTAISTQIFSEQLLDRKHLVMIKKAGFKVLEIFCEPRHFKWFNEAYVSSIAEVIRDLNLKVNSVHAPWAPEIDIASLDHMQRRHSVNQVLRSIDALKILNGKILVLHPGSKISSRKNLNLLITRSLQSIDEIATYCVEQNVALALENPPPDELGGNLNDFRIICDALANDGRVNYCFDTGHAHLTPRDIDLLKDLDKEILLVHVVDNMGVEEEHLLPPQGTIDWKHFMELLITRNFKGYLTLELMETSNPVSVMTQGMDWLRSLSSYYKNDFSSK